MRELLLHIFCKDDPDHHYLPGIVYAASEKKSTVENRRITLDEKDEMDRIMDRISRQVDEQPRGKDFFVAEECFAIGTHTVTPSEVGTTPIYYHGQAFSFQVGRGSLTRVIERPLEYGKIVVCCMKPIMDGSLKHVDSNARSLHGAPRSKHKTSQISSAVWVLTTRLGGTPREAIRRLMGGWTKKMSAETNIVMKACHEAMLDPANELGRLLIVVGTALGYVPIGFDYRKRRWTFPTSLLSWRRDHRTMDATVAAEMFEDVADLGAQFSDFANISGYFKTMETMTRYPRCHLYFTDFPELTGMPPHPDFPTKYDGTKEKQTIMVPFDQAKVLTPVAT